MRTVPAAAVFTRFDLHACGWSDGAISRAVRSGRVVRLRHGRFTLVPGPHADLRAALSSCGGSVASHRSALEVHGLPVVGTQAVVPEVTVAPRRIGRLLDAHLHRAGMPPEQVTVVGDIPVTTCARTLVDVGRSRSPAAAVAAIDKALHEGWVNYDDMYGVVAFCRNWPGIRRAVRAIELSDWRAESPLESVSRLVLGWSRLPAPEPQPTLLDGSGRFCGRTDFYWDEYGVVGEADGREKYDRRDVLTEEKQRQERLEDLGLQVIRWGWRDITRNPQATRRRIERAFERGLARDRAGLRREWSVRYLDRGQLPRKAA